MAAYESMGSFCVESLFTSIRAVTLLLAMGYQATIGQCGSIFPPSLYSYLETSDKPVRAPA